MKNLFLIIGVLIVITSCWWNSEIDKKQKEVNKIEPILKIQDEESIKIMKQQKITNLIKNLQKKKGDKIEVNQVVSEKKIKVKEKNNNETVVKYNLDKSNQKIKTNINIELKQTWNNIEILLSNPEKKTFQSVRTWLSFKKWTLNITKLNLNNIIFDLAAPNEYLVDKENWIIN